MSSTLLSFDLAKAVASHDVIDDIGTAAPMISATLALLALFSNARANKLSEQEKAGLDKQTGKELRADAAIDLALAIFAGLALLAMLPLVISGLCYVDLFRTARVVVSVFYLLYLGIGGVFAWQISIFIRRRDRLHAKELTLWKLRPRPTSG